MPSRSKRTLAVALVLLGMGACSGDGDSCTDCEQNLQSGGAGGEAGSSSDILPCSPVTGARAKALVDEGALLLDVRLQTEFAAQHLPGAVNVPVDELPDRLHEIPKDQVVVTYCGHGQRSLEAMTILCDAGYEAYTLGAMDNWPE